jgi:glycosyltransferase involved in cell wall biosynthesis
MRRKRKALPSGGSLPFSGMLLPAMKVLLISHNGMSRTAGQPKLHALAAYEDIELTALVPDRMNFYGTWETAEPPENPAFRFVVGRARWQSVAGQWYLQRYADALGPLLCETRPDIVNIWQEPWSLVCTQAVRLTRRLCPQAKILVETEQNVYKRLPPPFQQFQNYTLRHADFLIGRSQEALEVARRKGYTGPSRVVPNAVDCDLFRPMTKDEGRRTNDEELPTNAEGPTTSAEEPTAKDQRTTTRATLLNATAFPTKREGTSGPPPFLVGYIGRLVSEKGLADLLDALALLPEDFRLALIGSGPMRSELEARSFQLGVAERVHFVGELEYTALPFSMNALDALALPSRTTPRWKEQFGRVLIEAGACGIPVLGSNSGAIPEVVADAGLLFPEGDARALADALLTLRDNPTLRAQLGERGRYRAETLFSWQAVAAQMYLIYGEILGQQPSVMGAML